MLFTFYYLYIYLYYVHKLHICMCEFEAEFQIIYLKMQNVFFFGLLFNPESMADFTFHPKYCYFFLLIYLVNPGSFLSTEQPQFFGIDSS